MYLCMAIHIFQEFYTYTSRTVCIPNLIVLYILYLINILVAAMNEARLKIYIQNITTKLEYTEHC